MELKEKTSRIKLAFYCVMTAAFFALHVTLDLKNCVIVAAIALLSLLLMIKNRNSGLHFEKCFVSLELAILLLSAKRFYDYWIVARKVGVIAARLSMKSGTLLVLLAAICAAVSFCGLNILLSCLVKLRPVEKANAWLNSHPALKNGLLLFLIVSLQLFQLQRSTLLYKPLLFKLGFPYFLANLSALLTLYFILLLILRNNKNSALVLNLIITVFSIVNHYVILFHGAPLFPSEFAHAGTAFNVLSGYKFTIDRQVVDVIILFLTEMALSQILRTDPERKHLKNALLLVGSAALAYGLLFSPLALAERFPWTWKFDISHDGFIHSAAANFMKIQHPIRAPEGYDSEQIVLPEVSNYTIPEQRPDIIVIINETFCDLSAFTDIKTDLDYMDGFYGIENASYGYAFSPEIGGGTNNSEYEVLTSDSMFLLNYYAPFDYLELNEKNSTSISYLNSLGYESYAMHSLTGANYNRGVAYPALGFDHVFLGDNRLSDFNYNGNRPYLDKDEYAALKSLLESNDDQPKFLYLLTFQNHGGYEQNDASLDSVHTIGDYGDLTDDINEYVTSVSMSSAAINEFIHYLSGRDRPVILCMVGDHAPSFIQELNENRDMNSEEESLWQRAVPYIIWANFEYRTEELTEYTSMTDLIPMLLTAADMPLTPFYQQIINLHKSLPVRTPYGICLDSQNIIKHYENRDYPEEAMRQYLFMEYNELLQGEDYRPELFRIPAE